MSNKITITNKYVYGGTLADKHYISVEEDELPRIVPYHIWQLLEVGDEIDLEDLKHAILNNLDYEKTC